VRARGTGSSARGDIDAGWLIGTGGRAASGTLLNQ